VTKQQGETKRREQTAKEIRSQIAVNESIAERNITEIRGRADAMAKLILANASATATNLTISATSTAYKQLSD
jgi:regulator of protease activity HflC (stomatin/prohibitin superfamily)